MISPHGGKNKTNMKLVSPSSRGFIVIILNNPVYYSKNKRTNNTQRENQFFENISSDVSSNKLILEIK